MDVLLHLAFELSIFVVVISIFLFGNSRTLNALKAAADNLGITEVKRNWWSREGQIQIQ